MSGCATRIKTGHLFQKAPTTSVVGAFCLVRGLEYHKCNSPVECCCHQFKNWWLHLFSAKQKMQTSPVAVPGIFLADKAAASFADRCHSLRSLDSATGGAPIAPLVPLRPTRLGNKGTDCHLTFGSSQ